MKNKGAWNVSCRIHSGKIEGGLSNPIKQARSLYLHLRTVNISNFDRITSVLELNVIQRCKIIRATQILIVAQKLKGHDLLDFLGVQMGEK